MKTVVAPRADREVAKLMRDPSDKITIDVWLNDWPLWPELIEPVRDRAAEFNRAHPGYEVVVTGVDVRVLPKDVAEAARQGTAPHLAAYQYTYLQDALDARDGAGEPLFTSVTGAVGDREQILGEPVVLDDILANARDFYTFDGELTSMPRNTSTVLLFSNADALRAAGIARPPRTWAEVNAACETLAGRAGARSAGITWPNHGWFLHQSVAQQGGLLADNDNGRSGRAAKIDLASAEMLAFVTWWRDLHAAGHYLYTGKQLDFPGCVAAFAGGEVAMMLSSSVEAGPMVQAGRDAGFEVVVSAMPHNDQAPYVGTAVAGESLWLRAGLDEATQDGALAFLQFLTSARNAAGIVDHGRTFVPTTEAAIDLLAADGWFDRNPHFRAAIDQLREATDSPALRGAVFGEFLAIQNLTTQAMHDVLVTGDDPAARFGRATAEAQHLLDDYTERVAPATGADRCPAKR